MLINKVSYQNRFKDFVIQVMHLLLVSDAADKVLALE
jgi:hypothetical protein